MKWENYRKKKLQTAVVQTETKLNAQIAKFREYAQTYDVMDIVSFLPSMIRDIEETRRQLESIKDKLMLFNFLTEDPDDKE